MKSYTGCPFVSGLFHLTFSRFIRVVAYIRIPSLSMAKELLYTCHIVFMHSSVDEHLGCFLPLAIVNHAAVNIGI